jgi:hypothetical protein
MYNTKQIIIYSILSFLFAIIITLYYNKKIDMNFYIFFILLFIIFYLFFYLMNLEYKENFNNFNYYIEKYDTLKQGFKKDEMNGNYNNEWYKKRVFHQASEEEEEQHKIKKVVITEEEEIKTSLPINSNIIQEEEEKKETQTDNKNKIDIDSIMLLNNLKGNTCSPVNINISYNGENGAPKVDNKSCNSNNSKNLGIYQSRVYNNSDWIYGNNAWSNSPDFYIPTPNDLLPPYKNNIKNISQKENEVMMKKKYSDDKIVCPMMVNTPWSEYKSGDKEPSGYNL